VPFSVSFSLFKTTLLSTCVVSLRIFSPRYFLTFSPSFPVASIHRAFSLLLCELTNRFCLWPPHPSVPPNISSSLRNSPLWLSLSFLNPLSFNLTSIFPLSPLEVVFPLPPWGLGSARLKVPLPCYSGMCPPSPPLTFFMVLKFPSLYFLAKAGDSISHGRSLPPPPALITPPF